MLGGNDVIVIKRRSYSLLGVGLGRRGSFWIHEHGAWCLLENMWVYAHAEIVETCGRWIVTKCRVQRWCRIGASIRPSPFLRRPKDVADGWDNFEAQGNETGGG